MILVFSQYMRAVVPGGTCKSATEVRDRLVKFIDNDDGIVIVKSAGEAAWQMDPARMSPTGMGAGSASLSLIGQIREMRDKLGAGSRKRRGFLLTANILLGNKAAITFKLNKRSS